MVTLGRVPKRILTKSERQLHLFAFSEHDWREFGIESVGSNGESTASPSTIRWYAWSAFASDKGTAAGSTVAWLSRSYGQLLFADHRLAYVLNVGAHERQFRHVSIPKAEHATEWIL